MLFMILLLSRLEEGESWYLEAPLKPQKVAIQISIGKFMI